MSIHYNGSVRLASTGRALCMLENSKPVTCSVNTARCPAVQHGPDFLGDFRSYWGIVGAAGGWQELLGDCRGCWGVAGELLGDCWSCWFSSYREAIETGL